MKTTFKKLILDELKSKGLKEIVSKIKSIRYSSFSGGDAVDVDTVDLNNKERKILKDILECYQYGSFDGMQDMYISKDGADQRKRTAKYVHLQNEFSDEKRSEAIEELKMKWEIVDDKTAREKMDTWYDTAIHRILSEK